MELNTNNNFKEAAYLQAAQSYSIVVWSCGKMVVNCHPLKSYVGPLLANGWFRIHRSYLVNPLFIKNISEDWDFVAMESGKVLPISRRMKPVVNLLKGQMNNG